MSCVRRVDLRFAQPVLDGARVPLDLASHDPGIRRPPERIVDRSLKGDSEVVGLCIVSGAHMALLPIIPQQHRENDMEDVLVLAGGIIPDEDVAALQEAGVKGIFTPGASTQEIIDFIQTSMAQREAL